MSSSLRENFFSSSASSSSRPMFSICQHFINSKQIKAVWVTMSHTNSFRWSCRANWIVTCHTKSQSTPKTKCEKDRDKGRWSDLVCAVFVCPISTSIINNNNNNTSTSSDLVRDIVDHNVKQLHANEHEVLNGDEEPNAHAERERQDIHREAHYCRVRNDCSQRGHLQNLRPSSNILRTCGKSHHQLGSIIKMARCFAQSGWGQQFKWRLWSLASGTCLRGLRAGTCALIGSHLIWSLSNYCRTPAAEPLQYDNKANELAEQNWRAYAHSNWMWRSVDKSTGEALLTKGNPATKRVQ